MILVLLIAMLMASGVLALAAARWSDAAPRWITLIASVAGFVMLLVLWISNAGPVIPAGEPVWIVDYSRNWIPRFGMHFHLAADGLSLLLLMLTMFLSAISVMVSWKEITARVGFFHFNLMFIIAGIVGVFTALDLFLFYFFWEVMLIPMYFLIGIWGHERRVYASYKFFIFTQAGGLLMFIAILALYFLHGQATGEYTFDYTELLGTALSPGAALWIMLGFLAAFLVKLPAVPIHSWLPDAHTQAPTAGSVILAGLLLKTGAYGILRFVLPLFPGAAADFAPIAMLLGAVGILYGAMLAFAQTDFKRLVAYTSVSHMGFVLAGAFAFNAEALQGVVVQLLAHGLSTGALFVMAGLLQDRLHTRDIESMGGFWDSAPRMGAMGLIFAMASLGLPGFGNFVAEFLILLGVFKASVLWAVLAALGLVASTVYSLRIVQRIFHGKQRGERRPSDFNLREMTIASSILLILLWLGIYPQTFLDTSEPSTRWIQNAVTVQPRVIEPDDLPGYEPPDRDMDAEPASYRFRGGKLFGTRVRVVSITSAEAMVHSLLRSEPGGKGAVASTGDGRGNDRGTDRHGGRP